MGAIREDRFWPKKSMIPPLWIFQKKIDLAFFSSDCPTKCVETIGEEIRRRKRLETL